MGQVMMHGRLGPTRCTLVGVAAHNVWLSLFLPPGKRLWNSYLRNSWIGFDNSRCIWKPLVYRGAILFYQLRHRAGVEAQVFLATGFMLKSKYFYTPASPMLRLSDHWVGIRNESKSFEITFLCRSVRRYLTYPLDPSWVIITLWQIYHPHTNACRQSDAHCTSNFN